MTNEITKFDISKSVRFDSRTLATVGDYLVAKCGYEIATSTDLIRTVVEKFSAMIVASGAPEIETYAESREWFISRGLGDLFKQGRKQNKAHIRASADEQRMLNLIEGVSGNIESVSETEQSMLDSISELNVMRERDYSGAEPEDRKKDIDGIKNLTFDGGEGESDE